MAVIQAVNDDGKTVELLADEQDDRGHGRLSVTSSAVHPVVISAGPGNRLPVNGCYGTFGCSGTPSNVVTLAAAAANFVLPEQGGRYILHCLGGTAYIRWDGTAATANGAGMCIQDGMWIGPGCIPAGTISVIGAAAAGYLYIYHITGA